MEAFELFEPDVGESVRFRLFPVGCSGHVDPEFFNCEVLPLHLVDLLQFFLLVLDPLGIFIVFDLLLQYVLPELHASPMSSGFSFWMVFFSSSM